MDIITIDLVFLNYIWECRRFFFQDLKHFFQYALLASPKGIYLYHEFYNLWRGLHNDEFSFKQSYMEIKKKDL